MVETVRIIIELILLIFIILLGIFIIILNYRKSNKKIDEYIICPAIKRVNPKLFSYKCNEFPEIFEVELGLDHEDIKVRFGSEVSRNYEDQGFITSKGRFVDRFEAAKIAYNAGQVKSRFPILRRTNLY